MLSYHNRKINLLQERLGVKCAAFDLPCGWTCPFARDCRTKVVADNNGKRHAEKDGIFQCYASKAELLYPSVYWKRQENFGYSKMDGFAETLSNEIQNAQVKVVRIHTSGDFYNYKYYLKWREIVDRNPGVIFFGYTKSVDVAFDILSKNLGNFKIVYSWGGTHDEKAAELKLPTCYVALKDEYDGKVPVIDISKDAVIDYEYIMSGKSFAIRLH